MIDIKVRKSKRVYTDNPYSIFVTFPYDQKIVDTIRTIEGRRWNSEKKEWELPITGLETLIVNLPEFDFNINGYVDFNEEENESVKIPQNFSFKTSPFKHQVEGFEYGLSHNNWLLGDEQGLGKTKQVIDIAVAKKLALGYKHCLIVCGVNGLKWNWVEEIKTHSNEQAYILGQRQRAGKTVIGSTADKLKDIMSLFKANDNTPYFIITNVESLRNEQIVTNLKLLCQKKIINIVAADEVHKMKNPASQQGKGFLQIQPECKIAMTGTPLMNNPFDLYIILKWLGYEKHTFNAFKHHYATYGGYGGYEVIGYRYLDELQHKLDSIMLRRLKNDVLDLPEKTHITEYVEMTPKQAQIYKEISSEIRMNIDQIKMANNPLAELIRMRQATGYTGILSSKVCESAKLDRMEELVSDAIENNKQVVIFSNWTQMTDVVYDRLCGKYSLAIITGQTKDAERQQMVEKFQNGKAKVIIGTIGAMGTGITLTAGTVEIFLDEPWNRANKEQAEDRLHRIGQSANITIYTLICKDTIDERVHELVENKGKMADMLVDGKIVGDKSKMLDFLLS